MALRECKPGQIDTEVGFLISSHIAETSVQCSNRDISFGMPDIPSDLNTLHTNVKPGILLPTHNLCDSYDVTSTHQSGADGEQRNNINCQNRVSVISAGNVGQPGATCTQAAAILDIANPTDTHIRNNPGSANFSPDTVPPADLGQSDTGPTDVYRGSTPPPPFRSALYDTKRKASRSGSTQCKQHGGYHVDQTQLAVTHCQLRKMIYRLQPKPTSQPRNPILLNSNRR